MNVLVGIFVIVVLGIVADTVTKIVKAKSAGSPALRGQVDELNAVVQDQAAQLADAQATIASQAEQLQELHERMDFAERMLARVREQPRLGG